MRRSCAGSASSREFGAAGNEQAAAPLTRKLAAGCSSPLDSATCSSPSLVTSPEGAGCSAGGAPVLPALVRVAGRPVRLLQRVRANVNLGAAAAARAAGPAGRPARAPASASSIMATGSLECYAYWLDQVITIASPADNCSIVSRLLPLLHSGRVAPCPASALPFTRRSCSRQFDYCPQAAGRPICAHSCGSAPRLALACCRRPIPPGAA